MLSRLLGMLRIEVHASTARLETGLATVQEKLEHTKRQFQSAGRSMKDLGKAQQVFASLTGELGQMGGAAGKVTSALGGLAQMGITKTNVALAAVAVGFSIYTEKMLAAQRANVEFLDASRKNREELKALQDVLNEASGGPPADIARRRRAIESLEAQMNELQLLYDSASKNSLTKLTGVLYAGGEKTSLGDVQKQIDMLRSRVAMEREALKIAMETLKVNHLNHRADREAEGDEALRLDMEAEEERQNKAQMAASEILEKLRARLGLEERIARLQDDGSRAGDEILESMIRQREAVRDVIKDISEAEAGIGRAGRGTPFADEAAKIAEGAEKVSRARALLQRESALLDRLSTAEGPEHRARAAAAHIADSLAEAKRQIGAQRALVEEMQYLGELSSEAAAQQMRDLDTLTGTLEKSAALQIRRAELMAATEGKDFSKGFRAQIALMTEEVKNFGILGARVATQMSEGFAGGLTDALMSVVDGSKSAAKAFSEFARLFLLQTFAMIVQALILHALLLALGIAAPVTPTAVPSTPTSITDGGARQHGGAFRVGGAGGIDSQMVMFRATPGETVAVARPGDGGGGVHVEVINMTSSPARAEQTTGPDGRRRIRVLVGEAIAEDLAQGGPVTRSMQRHFGISRLPSREG